MLVINPSECIDCGVCEPECPAEAILPDTESGLEQWLEVNASYSAEWPNITRKKDPPGRRRRAQGRGGQVRQIFHRQARRGRLMASRPSPLAPIALSVLRIVAGLIFLEHGTQKFLGFPPGQMAGSGLALDRSRRLCRLLRDRLRPLDRARPVHPARRFPRLRGDGGRLLVRAFPARLFPGQQYGRRGDPLLLRLPLSLRRRTRAVEPRCLRNRGRLPQP